MHIKLERLICHESQLNNQLTKKKLYFNFTKLLLLRRFKMAADQTEFSSLTLGGREMQTMKNLLPNVWWVRRRMFWLKTVYKLANYVFATMSLIQKGSPRCGNTLTLWWWKRSLITNVKKKYRKYFKCVQTPKRGVLVV